MGDFSYWMNKLESHYLRKTGMKLHPGTLNVQLEQPYSLRDKPLRLEKEEYGGTVSVSFVPVPARSWGSPLSFYEQMVTNKVTGTIRKV